MRITSSIDGAPTASAKLAIAASNPVLRSHLGLMGTAAGFDVSYPDDPVDWARLHHGVVILTVTAPGALTTLDRLREASSRLTVITLVDSAAPRLSHAALRAGAHVVVDWLTDSRELLLTVRLARRGSALVPARLLHELVNQRLGQVGDDGPTFTLDDADRQLLLAVADGATIKRIARNRHQATRTVERHLQRLYARIGVVDRVQAVARAVQSGLVTVGPDFAPDPRSAGERHRYG